MNSVDPSIPATLPFPPATKPKRTRKPRATKPAAEKVKRERAKPLTLLSRVKSMGPHHLDAYRILGGTDEWEAGLRAEIAYDRDLATAAHRVIVAEDELKAAKAMLASFPPRSWSHMDALQTLAASIATAKGAPPA